jgi:hypothetical protein
MKKLLLFFLLCSSITHSKSITVFAHGIVDDGSQSQRFQKVISTSQIISPNFADAFNPSGLNCNNFLYTICSHFGKKINQNAMFMGQKDDIAVLERTVAQISDEKQIILYGCSRGAATIISYLGIYNPENIGAIVLDACPANISKTVQMTLAQLGINPNYCTTIFSYLFPQYEPKLAITPIQAIQTIKNKNLPILLMHSLEDRKVHYTDSLKLYQTFIEAGFTNVHLCLLPQGRHSYLLQDEHVKDRYTQAVHSFYKKYCLPYNSEIETDNFKFTPLTKEEIKDQIQKYQKEILKAYHSAYQRNIYYSTAIIVFAVVWWYLQNGSL